MPWTQRLLYCATFLCPAGVVVALLLSPEAGGLLLFFGSVAGLLGLHRFGRAGADTSLRLTSESEVAAPVSGLAAQHGNQNLGA
jgi:hypothetical protein